LARIRWIEALEINTIRHYLAIAYLKCYATGPDRFSGERNQYVGSRERPATTAATMNASAMACALAWRTAA